MKIPKDLGIKIGTPKEVLWTKVLKTAEAVIQQAEDEIAIQKELVKIAKDKILLEQRK